MIKKIIEYFKKRYERNHTVQLINKEKALLILCVRQPKGLFIYKDGDYWVGIDNRSGDCWTQAFCSRRSCERWLQNETI